MQEPHQFQSGSSPPGSPFSVKERKWTGIVQQVQDSTEQLRIRRRQSQDAAIAAVNILAPADTSATGFADEHASTADELPEGPQGLPLPTNHRRSRLLRGAQLADQQVTPAQAEPSQFASLKQRLREVRGARRRQNSSRPSSVVSDSTETSSVMSDSSSIVEAKLEQLLQHVPQPPLSASRHARKIVSDGPSAGTLAEGPKQEAAPLSRKGLGLTVRRFTPLNVVEMPPVVKAPVAIQHTSSSPNLLAPTSSSHLTGPASWGQCPVVECGTAAPQPGVCASGSSSARNSLDATEPTKRWLTLPNNHPAKEAATLGILPQQQQQLDPTRPAALVNPCALPARQPSQLFHQPIPPPSTHLGTVEMSAAGTVAQPVVPVLEQDSALGRSHTAEGVTHLQLVQAHPEQTSLMPGSPPLPARGVQVCSGSADTIFQPVLTSASTAAAAAAAARLPHAAEPAVTAPAPGSAFETQVQDGTQQHPVNTEQQHHFWGTPAVPQASDTTLDEAALSGACIPAARISPAAIVPGGCISGQSAAAGSDSAVSETAVSGIQRTTNASRGLLSSLVAGRSPFSCSYSNTAQILNDADIQQLLQRVAACVGPLGPTTETPAPAANLPAVQVGSAAADCNTGSKSTGSSNVLQDDGDSNTAQHLCSSGQAPPTAGMPHMLSSNNRPSTPPAATTAAAKATVIAIETSTSAAAKGAPDAQIVHSDKQADLPGVLSPSSPPPPSAVKRQRRPVQRRVSWKVDLASREPVRRAASVLPWAPPRGQQPLLTGLRQAPAPGSGSCSRTAGTPVPPSNPPPAPGDLPNSRAVQQAPPATMMAGPSSSQQTTQHLTAGPAGAGGHEQPKFFGRVFSSSWDGACSSRAQQASLTPARLPASLRVPALPDVVAQPQTAAAAALASTQAAAAAGHALIVPLSSAALEMAANLQHQSGSDSAIFGPGSTGAKVWAGQGHQALAADATDADWGVQPGAQVSTSQQGATDAKYQAGHHTGFLIPAHHVTVAAEDQASSCCGCSELSAMTNCEAYADTLRQRVVQHLTAGALGEGSSGVADGGAAGAAVNLLEQYFDGHADLKHKAALLQANLKEKKMLKQQRREQQLQRSQLQHSFSPLAELGSPAGSQESPAGCLRPPHWNARLEASQRLGGGAPLGGQQPRRTGSGREQGNDVMGTGCCPVDMNELRQNVESVLKRV